MPAHDANNATWYVLRYAEDFIAPPSLVAGISNPSLAPFGKPSAPYLQPTLIYDSLRGVLELQPEASRFAADPPPGIAVDLDGDVYCVDRTGVLVVVRCDGSSVPLPCEPGILAQPAGLALDRRGYLYVADPPAHRVVVIDPENGAVRAVLGGGGAIGALEEPVDVAVSPAGFIYVADRARGGIAVFSAGMKPLAMFPTAAVPGNHPQPIAVMIAVDGNLLVADAWFPQLLSYAPDGSRLADLEISSLLAPLAGGEIATGAFGKAYGERMPRFLVGSCGPCATPANDGPARLAEVHRALRLLALALGRTFEKSGCFISRALDGGRLGVPWHRVQVVLNGVQPEGTGVIVETFTSDSPTPADQIWDAPRDLAGRAISFTSEVAEQLVQSQPGRYLWLRVTLTSADGHSTPSIGAILAWYPRSSWLDLLPTAYRKDPESASFLSHFLALFEHVFTGVEDRYETFSRELNPDAAPREVIDWLAALIDLAFDASWPIERRRALVAEAMSLYRTRGTVAGLVRYVEIYTGIRPEIVEGWLERPARPAYLGRPGTLLGCGFALGCCPSPAALPDDELWARYAHRFTIYVYVDNRCDTEVTVRVVDRIVEVSKPAHTEHRSEAIFPEARVGMQSRVGLDLVLGAPVTAATSVGQGSLLGMDSVLGARRPQYIQPLEGGIL